MRSFICAAAVFAVLLVTIPAIPFAAESIKGGEKSLSLKENTDNSSSAPDEKDDEQKNDTLKILDINTGEVFEMSAYDYAVGAVCAQMPAAFEPEALKAQAVTAFTYAFRQREKAETSPDKTLCGAYFSNDTKKYQAFFTESQQKHYYGENYDEYIEKIKKAVLEVNGKYMTYDGEPIIAAFHALSTGKTESAENIWGSRIPYLVSVESEYDETSPNYIKEYTFTQSDMKDALEKAFEGIELADEPEKWFEEPEKSEADTVLSQQAGDKELTGQQLRSALSLCSAAFDIKYEDDGFTVTAKGSGHGVGMSQFGANELAKTGKTYDEILKHYYKGVEIED